MRNIEGSSANLIILQNQNQMAVNRLERVHVLMKFLTDMCPYLHIPKPPYHDSAHSAAVM